jgi:hypothetical protein
MAASLKNLVDRHGPVLLTVYRYKKPEATSKRSRSKWARERVKETRYVFSNGWVYFKYDYEWLNLESGRRYRPTARRLYSGGDVRELVRDSLRELKSGDHKTIWRRYSGFIQQSHLQVYDDVKQLADDLSDLGWVVVRPKEKKVKAALVVKHFNKSK